MITLKNKEVSIMDKKEKVVEKTTNEQNIEELEIQTTFNEDRIDILVEDGIVENLEEVVENANEDK
jgi:uncharacterized coiled-coil protein SlyX